MQLFDDLEDFGSFDDAVSGDVRDPYTELARLRREEPIQRLDVSGMPHEEAKPVFIAYRYEDVQQMLRDNDTFSRRSSSRRSATSWGSTSCSEWMSPTTAAIAPWYQRRSPRRRLPSGRTVWVGQVGNMLIDRFVERGRADLVKEFTFDYPTLIIAGLLGLPREDYPPFQRWSISLLGFVINPERGLAASNALRDYFAPILAARRAEPREDLITSLATAQIDGEQLSDEEIFSFLRLLLPAGVETTYRALGNMLFGLLSDPAQLDALRGTDLCCRRLSRRPSAGSHHC